MRFSRFFRRVAFFSFLGIAFLLGINSCSQISGAINEPVREYFENLSDGAQIISYKIFIRDASGNLVPAPTAKDASGHTCVGSVNDVVVKLQLRNPNNFNFTLGSNFSYSLVDSTTAAIPGSAGITIAQTSQTEMTLTYPSGFLTAAEYGKNISEHIELSHPSTGTSFPDFMLPLYCNSAPPAIKDAAVYTNTSSGKYVIAFTVPNLDISQTDLKYIIIGGTTIPITVTTTGATPFNYLHPSLVAANIGTISPPCTPNGTAYSNTGGTAFYFNTPDNPSAADKVYTLSLVDAAGITTTVSVNSNSAYTLKNVTLTDSSGTIHNGSSTTPATLINLGQDTGYSYAKVRISVPTQAVCNTVTKAISGASVSYTVTDSATSTEVASGTKTSAFDLTLAPGEYTIECTATKAGYVDSVTTFSVKVIATTLYVKSTGDDGDPGNGTEEHPYKTIHFADSKFPAPSDTPTGAVRTIYVLDDLGSEQPDETTIANTDCINCQNHTLTDVKLSIGNGCVVKNATIAGIDATKKIVGANKTLENVVLAKTGTAVEAVTGKVTLKNVSSTNNNIINANPIIIKGKVSGLTFKLGTSTKLKIEGSLAGSSNNKIVLTAAAYTTFPRIFTEDYSTYNGSVAPSTYFKSDDYSVRKDSSSGEAILKEGSGASGDITVYTPDEKLTLTATPGTATTTATPVTISATGTLEDGTDVTAPDAKFTGWDIKLYYEYDYRHSASPSPIITPTTSPSTALNIQNEWPAGNYVIVVNVTFNGTAYCQELIYTKS